MTIDGKDQVTLKVRFVEMQRSVIKQMGINLSGSIGFLVSFGHQLRQQFHGSPSNAFPIAGSALGGLAANLGYKNLSAQRRKARWAWWPMRWSASAYRAHAAEPNLAALSGEAGKFLVGGEFPVPVAQDEGKRSRSSSSRSVPALAIRRSLCRRAAFRYSCRSKFPELSQQGGFRPA